MKNYLPILLLILLKLSLFGQNESCVHSLVVNQSAGNFNQTTLDYYFDMERLVVSSKTSSNIYQYHIDTSSMELLQIDSFTFSNKKVFQLSENYLMIGEKDSMHFVLLNKVFDISKIHTILFGNGKYEINDVIETNQNQIWCLGSYYDTANHWSGILLLGFDSLMNLQFEKKYANLGIGYPTRLYKTESDVYMQTTLLDDVFYSKLSGLGSIEAVSLFSLPGSHIGFSRSASGIFGTRRWSGHSVSAGIELDFLQDNLQVERTKNITSWFSFQDFHATGTIGAAYPWGQDSILFGFNYLAIQGGVRAFLAVVDKQLEEYCYAQLPTRAPKNMKFGANTAFFVESKYNELLIDKAYIDCLSWVCSTDSISPAMEQAKFTNIEIRPNPFRTNAFVDFLSKNNEEKIVFKLYNLTGRLVRNEIVYNDFFLERKDLAPGIYFGQFFNAQMKHLKTEKIIIEE